jgi:hypothetical protein
VLNELINETVTPSVNATTGSAPLATEGLANDPLSPGMPVSFLVCFFFYLCSYFSYFFVDRVLLACWSFPAVLRVSAC